MSYSDLLQAAVDGRRSRYRQAPREPEKGNQSMMENMTCSIRLGDPCNQGPGCSKCAYGAPAGEAQDHALSAGVAGFAVGREVVAGTEGVGKGGPGLKDDQGKARYDLVPPEAIRALADILTYGARKYAENGWVTVPNPVPRYTAAAMRHIEAWRSGEELDPETGKPHLEHALCNLAFLVTLARRSNSRLDTGAGKQ